MHPYLLIFEFIGTGEMLIIAVVALIVFGPRKLPEIGRTIGKSLGEFRRASEDFKRTWEREVEVERIEGDLRVDREVNAVLAEVNDAVAATVSRGAGDARAAEEEQTGAVAGAGESDDAGDAGGEPETARDSSADGKDNTRAGADGADAADESSAGDADEARAAGERVPAGGRGRA